MLFPEKFVKLDANLNEFMKILHTADWHIGKKLDQFHRLGEQREVLNELIEIADSEEVDAVIVAGDLYDNFNPTTEAIELFYNTVKRLSNNGKRPVIAIAGNHDSPDRIEVSDPLARACGIILSGHPQTLVKPFSMDSGWRISKSDHGFLEIEWDEFDFPLRVIHTPFANEYRLKTFLGIENPEAQMREVLSSHWNNLVEKYCDNKGANILLSHLFVAERGKEIPEEPDGEKPIVLGNAQIIYPENLPDGIQYAALGHLHRYQIVKGKDYPVVYSSSPLSYSFAESGQTKYAVLIDIEPAQPVQYRPLPLSAGRPLVRKRFEEIDRAVEWLMENKECLVEITLAMKDYLSSEDRKRLYQAHDGIITLIPEIQTEDGQIDKLNQHQINLEKNIAELFSDYFIFRHGQNPSEELMSLFKEVQSRKS